MLLAALGGNLAVAAVKFVAFALTRSSAMLSEAVHSLVDTADQLLLLLGQRRARRPADEGHPFGFGMEMYFWSFVVALLIFFVGGAAAVWQGIDKVLHPIEVQRPLVSFGVLAACAVFEGFSFRTAYREYRTVVGKADVSVLRFIRLSKDPGVFTTLMEDGAALAGLGLAALGIAGARFLHLPWADGAASIAIGLLLLVVAGLLANETRSLIAGEAAAPSIQRRIRDAAQAAVEPGRLRRATSLQLGPGAILVFLSLDLPPDLTLAQVQTLAAKAVSQVKAVDPRILDVVFGGFGPAPEAG